MPTLSARFEIVRNPPARIPGTKLAGLFKALQAEPEGVVERSYLELLSTLDISRDHKLSQTGIAMARLIDQDARAQGQPNYGGHGNHYHNRNHMLEVLVSSALLLRVHERENFEPKFTRLEKLLVLTAALGHDLGHDGVGNGMGQGRVPLLNETRSIKLAEPIMAEKFGRYRQEQMDEAFSIYRALLVSTDIGGGPDSPARIFIETAAHLRGERAELPTVDTPERQYHADLMAAHPHLAEMSCILQDADLFPATCITPEWIQRQEKTLGSEVPARLNEQGDVNWNSALWFQNNLASPKSLAGKTFSPNREKTRAFVQTMADAQKPAPL